MTENKTEPNGTPAPEAGPMTTTQFIEKYTALRESLFRLGAEVLGDPNSFKIRYAIDEAIRKTNDALKDALLNLHLYGDDTLDYD